MQHGGFLWVTRPAKRGCDCLTVHFLAAVELLSFCDLEINTELSSDEKGFNLQTFDNTSEVFAELLFLEGRLYLGRDVLTDGFFPRIPLLYSGS